MQIFAWIVLNQKLPISFFASSSECLLVKEKPLGSCLFQALRVRPLKKVNKNKTYPTLRVSTAGPPSDGRAHTHTLFWHGRDAHERKLRGTPTAGHVGTETASGLAAMAR